MQIRFYATRDRADLSSNRICSICAGLASHIGACVWPDGAGDPFRFETLWKVWEPTGQDGPRGPLPLQPLLDWEAGDPRRKVIWTPPLPMSGAEIERFIGRAEPSVGTIRYARLGLFHNWLHQRCNVSISGGRKSSVAHWQCAETLVRWCDPETRCRVFLAGEFRYDDYVPSSGRAAGVMEMALEWARRAGITDCAFASSATACGQAL